MKTSTDKDKLTPLESPTDAMRHHSLAMHEDIRRAIRGVLELAQRAMNGDGSVALELEQSMQQLAYDVRRHVAAEERDADETIQKLGAWGANRRRQLATDHEKEIEAVFNVEYYGSHLAMAQDAARIANELLAAFRHEEEVALAPEPLADDPQTAGSAGPSEER